MAKKQQKSLGSFGDLGKHFGLETPKTTQPVDSGYSGSSRSGYAGNLGYYFNRMYYQPEGNHSLDFLNLDNNEAFFKEKNAKITSCGLPATLLPVLGNTQINLKTTYPGLAVGLGYGHGVKAKGEFKLGFSFDYTTGLPVVPGSTVKGMLRSAFPNRKLHKNTPDRLKQAKDDYLMGVLETVGVAVEGFSVDDLEREIFQGSALGNEEELLPVAKRDTFFDAIIAKANTQNKIFGDDSITPHPHPLKNPIPLLFMKVMPNVTFRFDFALHDGLISAEHKTALFRLLLLDFGIGAKTNVGYGQLTDPQS